MMSGRNFDEYFMRMAIKLAKKGLGLTSPNPAVGALVVKDGRIIARGWHKRAGAEHAEAEAIKRAGKAARGATLYVNLEPCCHFGRTPPCTQIIIDSGIKRVVAGMEDPNPLVSGRGISILKENGIETTVGVLEEDCRQLNEFFVKYIKEKEPFLILKIASTLDGKIATPSGESKWITSFRARRHAHMMRNLVDAIMVGIGTVLADDSRLTVRLVTPKKQPYRVVVDSFLNIPVQAKLIEAAVDGKTIIFHSGRADARKKRALAQAGAVLMEAPEHEEGKLDIRWIIKRLGELEITSVIIEGGPQLAYSAVKAGAVDKFLIYMAPSIMGGEDSPGMIGGKGPGKIDDLLRLKNIKIRKLGEDLLITAYPEKRCLPA